mgnify:CR=1 FL=1
MNFEVLTIRTSNIALSTQLRDYQVNRGSEKAKGESFAKEMQVFYKQKIEEEYKKLGCMGMADLLNLLGRDGWEPCVGLQDTIILKRPVNT